MALAAFTHCTPVRRLATAIFVAATAVVPAPLAAAGADFWLETALEPQPVYVQARATLTLRLFQAVDIRELALHAPSAELAELQPIGEASLDEAVRDGRRYRVTERRFQVFPFASGELTLAGAHATGSVPLRGAAPGTRETLRIDVPPAVLTVRPIPAGVGSEPWLPAETLQLSDAWEDGVATARAGESLRRVIRIEAKGLAAAQLPELRPAGVDFSAHAEPPRLEDRIDDDQLVGVREQAWRIVPSREGSLEIPPVRLRWWNVKTDRPEDAILPSRTIEVSAGVAPPVEPSHAPEAAHASSSAPPPDAQTAAPRDGNDRRVALAAALVAAATLGLGSWAAWSRRPGVAARRRLHRACRRGDALAAREALLQWGRELWPGSPPQSLGALGEKLPTADARREVAELDRHLYGPAPGDWHGHLLARSLRQVGHPQR